MAMQEKPITKRDVGFSNRPVTRIWHDIPSKDNPYLTEKCRCHGYDLLDLASKRSFIDVFFLLFQGELPEYNQSKLLETLFIALINPGPLHPAVRAAMYAGVGKTNGCHLLPIGLSILGGDYLGGEEVVHSMEFLQKNRTKDIPTIISELLKKNKKPKKGDWHIVPGFGSRFGSIDPMPKNIAEKLVDCPGSGVFIKWGDDFAKELLPINMGWLITGLAAAAFCDLGFPPRAGAGLFQLLRAPGILAHGLELTNKPITAMPFLDEKHYVIEQKKRRD